MRKVILYQGRIQGRQLSGGGGAPTYEIAKFSEKLHEIEKISGRRGGGAPPKPPNGYSIDKTNHSELSPHNAIDVSLRLSL